MRLAWPFGLLFAVGAAVATNVGFLMRHRGAVEAPDVDARRPVRTTVELFRRRWWTLGFAVAVVAWLLQVVALRIAPLSLVQAALASGFVVLGVIAERFFGFHVGRRQWIGIGLTTGGLALLAGIVVFGGPVGSNQLVVALRIAAFALVVVAAALMPAPVRAAEAVRRQDERGGERVRSAIGTAA